MCDFTHCVSGKVGTIRVIENIGDGSWNTMICRPCSMITGLNEGDDIPADADRINKLLLAYKRKQ